MVRGSPPIHRKTAPLKSGATQTFRVRAIVFDLDGVLVDSMPAIRAFWTEWAGKHGVNPEMVLAALHLTAEELIIKFAPSLDANTEARATAAGQAQMETGIVALEGARALIDTLPLGAWAVVTSGRRELALRHLALGQLPVPDVLVTAEDTPRGKPDPSGYLLAAEGLGIPPARCLAIEDSPAGVSAARSAGMAVLAVTNSHPASELTIADAVLDSLTSLRLTVDEQPMPIEVVISRA
jgi:sugar-phosphatase